MGVGVVGAGKGVGLPYFHCKTNARLCRRWFRSRSVILQVSVTMTKKNLPSVCILDSKGTYVLSAPDHTAVADVTTWYTEICKEYYAEGKCSSDCCRDGAVVNVWAASNHTVGN